MAGSPFAARELACPVCNVSFKLHTPKSGTSVLERRDADFCPYYSGINPLFYSVWVCPHCGFAALKEHFRELSGNDKVALAMALSGAQEHRRHDFSKEERSLFAAMLSFQLALKSYEVRRMPPEVRAGVLLRLAWTCRYGNDRKRERLYLEQASMLYQEAYDKGVSRNSSISEAHVAFLVGEAMRRLGRGPEAIDWFLRAVKDDPSKGETYRMARDQLYETKESIRFFEYLQAVDILKPLAIEELAQLAVQVRCRTFGAGKTICTEGDAGASMCILMSGHASVSIGEAKVAEVRPGQVFGEMSLLSGQPRSATVTADQPTELLEIDRVAFKTVLHSNPAIADEIARIVGERQAQNAKARESGALEATVPAESEAGFLGRFKAFFEIS